MGIWSALLVIFAVWEFKGLERGVKAFQDLPKLKFVFEAGPAPYLLGMIAWTILILGMGYIWSKIFFPNRNRIEKFIFSLCFGVVIMPISFLIPFFFAVTGMVFANLLGLESPAYAGEILKARGALLVNNHEQVYELVNVLFFTIVGVVILFIKKTRERNPSVERNFPKTIDTQS